MKISSLNTASIGNVFNDVKTWKDLETKKEVIWKLVNQHIKMRPIIIIDEDLNKGGYGLI